MVRKCLLLAGIALVLASTGSIRAQDDDTEAVGKLDLKTLSCAQFLEAVEADDGRSEVVTVWAHGFYTARHALEDQNEPITWRTVAAFASRLSKACEASPNKLWIEAVKQVE
jgi:HdeA/HdeB family